MRNDFQDNLINSITMAGLYNIPEVSIMFNSKLFRGCRSTKKDNKNLDGMDSPNFPHLADIGIHVNIRWNLITNPIKNDFSFFEHVNTNIVVVKFFPMLKEEVFIEFLKEPTQGINYNLLIYILL